MPTTPKIDRTKKDHHTDPLGSQRTFAELGYPHAQYTLGYFYAEGIHVKQDYSQALRWWQEAARYGEKSAQSHLGLLYLEAKGVQKDYFEAYFWLSLGTSMSKTHPAFKEAKEGALKHLTREQVEEINKRVNEWIPADSPVAGIFDRSLAKLKGSSVSVFDNDAYPVEKGCAPVRIVFGGDTDLRADYWRAIKDGREVVSSFDHNQKYALPAPINAKEALGELLRDKSVLEAMVDSETGDLSFEFNERVKLSVFAFTSYEMWEMRFPDGTVQYSNYAKN